EKLGTKETTRPPPYNKTSRRQVRLEKSGPLAATKALESYDVPEDDPEVDLEDLIDGYLEVLATWLPEPKNT
ncbi:1884_t:CDS:1, partial [Racocetra persica]